MGTKAPSWYEQEDGTETAEIAVHLVVDRREWAYLERMADRAMIPPRDLLATVLRYHLHGNRLKVFADVSHDVQASELAFEKFCAESNAGRFDTPAET